jgi:hypothetical protein
MISIYSRLLYNGNNELNVNMDKIVYLFGTGSTCAEMNRQGIESDVSMRGIGKNVIDLSRKNNGGYSKLQQTFTIPEDQDIEIIISLMEGFRDPTGGEFKKICEELRLLFRLYLTSQICEKHVKPVISSAILDFHKNYPAEMGASGEKLTGVLTTNYDSVLDDAFSRIYGGVSYGYPHESEIYKPDNSIPPLLKLHGSFNWKLNANKLIVSRNFENEKVLDGTACWMPPSVFKRPSENVYQQLWATARNLLVDCDILRVVGCSLRTEDFALISLIFTSQITNNKAFKIECIIPDTETTGEDEDSSNGKAIMQRLSFLGKVQYFSSLPVFQHDSFIAENVYLSWVLMKLKEMEKNLGKSLEDPYINELLATEGNI